MADKPKNGSTPFLHPYCELDEEEYAFDKNLQVNLLREAEWSRIYCRFMGWISSKYIREHWGTFSIIRSRIRGQFDGDEWDGKTLFPAYTLEVYWEEKQCAFSGGFLPEDIANDGTAKIYRRLCKVFRASVNAKMNSNKMQTAMFVCKT